jgi:hypothetical protein
MEGNKGRGKAWSGLPPRATPRRQSRQERQRPSAVITGDADAGPHPDADDIYFSRQAGAGLFLFFVPVKTKVSLVRE